MRKSDGALKTIAKSWQSVQILYRVAPLATILKIVQQIVSSAMGPLSLFLIQKLVDSITYYVAVPVDITPIIMWTVFLVLAAMLSDNINYVGAIQVVTIQRKIEKKLVDVLMDRLANLDYAYLEDPEMRDTLQRIGVEPQWRVFNVFQGVTDLIASAIAITGLCLIVSQVFVWFSVLLFFVLVLIIWFQFKGISMQVSLWGKQAVDDREMNYLIEILSEKHSLYELKVFDAVGYIQDKWGKTAKRVLSDRVSTAIKALRYHMAGNAFVVAWQVVMTVFSVVSILNGAITLGLFVSIVTSTKAITSIKNTLEMAFYKISRFQLEMQHISSFMALPTKENEAKQVMPPITKAQIRFDQVCFTYPGTDNQILNDVSFILEPGRHVALVGRNGAGKSTIVKLLCRLYKPDSGSITIDGFPLDDIPANELREWIGFIFQDFACYDLTIRENVGLGACEKMHDDEALLKALRTSGFDTNVYDLDCALGKITDDGIDLSGGQWQRLALARAQVAQSPLVVLDEPTASLDPIAESEMYYSFSEAMKDSGCLIISHRLVSAKMCDEILVLEKGNIVEHGSHDELMQAGGLYAQMFSLQSSWYSKDSGVEHKNGGDYE